VQRSFDFADFILYFINNITITSFDLGSAVEYNQTRIAENGRKTSRYISWYDLLLCPSFLH
jgi:hypothetical protein